MPIPELAKGWSSWTSFTGTSPAVPAEQLGLFPKATVLEFPAPDTKDIHSFVEADDRRRYYLKIDAGDMPIRASEWLCYRIANWAGVPTPRCDFIQTFSKDIAFGSEAIDGALSQAETVLFLETSSMNELGQPVAGLQKALSTIHAFDLFVRNVDRHMANFLVIGTGDEKRLLALDHARAAFWRWPWDSFGKPDEATTQIWTELRSRHGFDLSAALAVVDRIGLLNVESIGGILSAMPSHWLAASKQEELLTYCREGHWAARVAALRSGLGNGSII